MAAVVGIDPTKASVSLRQLEWMFRAKVDHDYNNTCYIISAIYEQNRDRKKRRKPYILTEFHPLHMDAVKKASGTVHDLKKLFGKKLGSETVSARKLKNGKANND